MEIVVCQGVDRIENRCALLLNINLRTQKTELSRGLTGFGI
jgi:hypothetical protein